MGLMSWEVVEGQAVAVDGVAVDCVDDNGYHCEDCGYRYDDCEDNHDEDNHDEDHDDEDHDEAHDDQQQNCTNYHACCFVGNELPGQERKSFEMS